MKTKKSKYLQYSPGDIVAVPMQRGGWGIALIARKPISQKCGDAGIWCIGFDRVYDTPPQPDCYEGLTILDAAVFQVCGDLNIAERIWPIIGSIPSYDPQQWPLPPTTFVFWRDVRHPIPPDRQRIIITEDVELRDINIKNNGFVPPDKYHLLPCGAGLGGRDMLSYALALAVKDRHQHYYFKPTPEALAVWADCIERVKQAGLYPAAEPY